MKAPGSFTDASDDLPLDLAIQRCADGELGDAQERALLARLEFQPQGWRRLALTFVENRLLGTVSRNWLANSSAATAARPMSDPHHRASVGWPSWVAMSLAVLLAFLAGRGWRTASSSTREDGLAVRHDIGEGAIPRVEMQDRTNDRPIPADRNGNLRPAVGRTPVMFVNLTLPGEEQGIPVPIYSTPEDVVGWQPFERPAITRAQADRLRRAGYDVTTTRHLLPVASPDGSQILLPVESVNVLPARY